jgi:hypothetical protein
MRTVQRAHGTGGYNSYAAGATVTVLGNTGALPRQGIVLRGGIQKRMGRDKLSAGGTFTMGSANVTL